MNDTLFTTLIEQLDKEIKLHEKLVSTASSINVALLKDQVEDVKNNSQSYEELMYEVEKCEDRRKEICFSIAENVGLQPQSRLKDFIDKAEPKFSTRLQEQHSLLKKIMNELAKINTSNKVLLEVALDAVNNTFSMIAKAGTKKETTYSKIGNKPENKVIPSGFINKFA